MCVCALRSVQLCDPINRRPSGSSVHGILQARILEWVALSYSRGSSRPRDGMRVSRVSCTGRWFFTTAPPEKLLGSFNGPGPGGPESTIRKWKREPEGRREREREREREKERKKERKKDTGTQALMEQRCFNDLSVSIYRLLYKKFLLRMIKIRKPNVQQPLPREQGINVTRSGDNPYLNKEDRD